MNIEEVREYCISKKGTDESFPFDQVTSVFKVMGKMFALLSLDGDLRINLKCNPEKAIALRTEYSAIKPGYHMNKKHWNSVYIVDTLSRQQITEMIDHSYDLIVASLTKKLKAKLANM